MLYRKKLRKLCRNLEKGVKPENTGDYWPNPVPTYGGDTVLNIPRDAKDDANLLRDTDKAVMEIQFDCEALTGSERDEQVIKALKQLEAGQS